MRKRFIILIDLSERSAGLLRYAGEWAEHAHAELVLVHQPAMIIPALADKAMKEEVLRQARKTADQQLNELRKECLPAQLRVSTVISENNLLLTVKQLLEDRSFDNLIVVGLKGTGLLKQLFIGSVAIQMIERADNTVAAIPKDIIRFSPGKLFVAVSDKHPFNILAFNNFLDFTGSGVETITFFHLAKPNEDTSDVEKHLQDLVKLFSPRIKTTYTLYEGAHSFSNMKEIINAREEETLIVQRGSRLLTDQIFRKFLINELVYEGSTPLIVLP